MWFNPAVFAAPANGSFGNFRRNSIYGPGVNNWNMSLFKNFNFTESMRIQLRFEAYNVFNHTQWANINNGLSSPVNGTILLRRECGQLGPDHECARSSSAATRRQVLLLTSFLNERPDPLRSRVRPIFFCVL